jgi:hypothetical protein
LLLPASLNLLWTEVAGELMVASCFLQENAVPLSATGHFGLLGDKLH